MIVINGHIKGLAPHCDLRNISVGILGEVIVYLGQIDKFSYAYDNEYDDSTEEGVIDTTDTIFMRPNELDIVDVKAMSVVNRCYNYDYIIFVGDALIAEVEGKFNVLGVTVISEDQIVVKIERLD